MALMASECGADIVVGTHPHVVQGVDRIGSSVVLWSLGNLMFGGTLEMSTFDAALCRLTLQFDGWGYAGCIVRMIPILTSGQAEEGINDCRPVVAQGEDYDRIMRLIRQDSGVTVTDEIRFQIR